MKYIVAINGKNYEVEVEKGQARIVKTTANVSSMTPSPHPHSQEAAPVSVGAAIQTDGEALKAPMPGTILDIKMAQGAAIKKGAILFILEAMKMENEITAPQDGVVAQIVVAKGASVAAGDILAVLR